VAEQVVVLSLEEALGRRRPVGSLDVEVVDHRQGGELVVGEAV